ncbi:MAG: hypothetical protein DRH15_04800 [Deltaproteobacteria bacterium]|nr:MAG: hypothetical protein DRH15_04800 [Deltaproteobacteria bacterium]
MEPLTFTIKSIAVQDTIMLLALGVVVFFLVLALRKKSSKHILVSFIWLLAVLWFFNSPLFGFSRVTVSTAGIKIEYGVLSLRNTTVPLDTPWKIESHASGLRRLRKVYTLRIGNHQSMRVKSREDLELLKEIGRAIDEVRGANRARHR